MNDTQDIQSWRLAAGSLQFLKNNVKLFFLAVKTVVLSIFILNVVSELLLLSLDMPVTNNPEFIKENAKKVSFWLKYGPIALATLLVHLYFHACFVLSWHKIVLKDLDPSYIVNPFKLDKFEFKFVRTVFYLFFYMFFVILMWPITILFFTVIAKFLGINALLLKILFFVILPLLPVLWEFKKVLGSYFVLPVRSIGEEMSFQEAQSYSKGLKRKWVISFSFLSVAYAALVFLVAYFATMLDPVAAYFEGEIETSIVSVVISNLFSIPAIILSFVFTACNVTILSFLYQWSVKNR